MELLAEAQKYPPNRAKMEKLLEHEDVNTRDPDPDPRFTGYTSLMYIAFHSGEGAFIRLLLDHGADPNLMSVKDHDTALMIAAEDGYPDCVRELLAQKETDVNLQDVEGKTALYRACETWQLAIVEMLLKRGADPNRAAHDGTTPVLVSFAFLETLNLLLEHGADVNHPNVAGLTVLMEIAKRSNTELTPALLETALSHGAHVDATDDEQKTALYYATQTNHAETVRFLLEKGANPNFFTTHGAAPLHEASLAGYKEIVMELLTHGADPNLATVFSPTEPDFAIGETPLMCAAMNSHPETVKTLLEHGADPNRHNSVGASALGLALGAYTSEETLLASVTALLTHGADVNEVFGPEKRTGLMIAVQMSSEPLVRLFLERGADLTRTDADGKTAASFTKDPDLLELLMGTEKPLWRGKTGAEMLLFNRVFENLENLSVCPFCFDYAERMDGCKMMSHKCEAPVNRRRNKLYERKNKVVNWCSLCSRPTDGFHHFALTDSRDTEPPEVVQPEEGANVYIVTDAECRLEGGGGLDEKLRRIQGMITALCAEQAAVGRDTEQAVRVRILDAAWDAAAQEDMNVESLRDTGKFIVPCEFPEVLPVVAAAENAPNLNDPAQPLPIEHTGGECFVEGGVPDDGSPVYEFRHRQPDGTVYTHPDHSICKADLEKVLANNTFGKEKKCPIQPDVCKGKLYPRELLPLFGAASPVYTNWKRRFNERNRVGGGLRSSTPWMLRIRGGRTRRTVRRSTQRGGVLRPFFSPMTNAKCVALPYTTTRSLNRRKRSTRRKR